VSVLSRVQCTAATYQRASPTVSASLSNGQTYTVTAQSSYGASDAAVGVAGSGSRTLLSGTSVGAATITATFSTVQATQPLSVVDTVVAVSELTLTSTTGDTL
jgi:hypothetical protein